MSSSGLEDFSTISALGVILTRLIFPRYLLGFILYTSVKALVKEDEDVNPQSIATSVIVLPFEYKVDGPPSPILSFLYTHEGFPP